MKSITSTRRDARPGTGSGTATAGRGRAVGVCDTDACTFSAACASQEVELAVERALELAEDGVVVDGSAFESLARTS